MNPTKAKCLLRLKNGDHLLVWVDILTRYQNGITCVRMAQSDVEEKEWGEIWLVRDGIEEGNYLSRIIQCWKCEIDPGKDFRPKRKIPEELLQKIEKLNASDLVLAIAQLREKGFLPPLPALTPETGPKNISWSQLRESFQDFKNHTQKNEP